MITPHTAGRTTAAIEQDRSDCFTIAERLTDHYGECGEAALPFMLALWVVGLTVMEGDHLAYFVQEIAEDILSNGGVIDGAITDDLAFPDWPGEQSRSTAGHYEALAAWSASPNRTRSEYAAIAESYYAELDRHLTGGW